MVYNAGVKRQIAMSFGFEFTRNPEAISDLIRDEQIKVTGCRFAQSPFTPLLNDFPLRCVCESIIVVTPALINLERSGRLINVWSALRNRKIPPRQTNQSLNRNDSNETNRKTEPQALLLWAVIFNYYPFILNFIRKFSNINFFFFKKIKIEKIKYKFSQLKEF